MSTLRSILRELAGLFVDDGNLAISIIIVVVMAAMFAGVAAPVLVTGGILFVGCAIVLIVNVLSVARKEP